MPHPPERNPVISGEPAQLLASSRQLCLNSTEARRSNVCLSVMAKHSQTSCE